MYHIVTSQKSFEQAASDLEAIVPEHNFGVLHIHDIGQTLRDKGMDYDGSCKVFEVCNPKQAMKVLAVDMKLNMALPCRISVYIEGGETKIGLIKPAAMLAGLSDNPELIAVAHEVEEQMIAMIEDAK